MVAAPDLDSGDPDHHQLPLQLDVRLPAAEVKANNDQHLRVRIRVAPSDDGSKTQLYVLAPLAEQGHRRREKESSHPWPKLNWSREEAVRSRGGSLSHAETGCVSASADRLDRKLAAKSTSIASIAAARSGAPAAVSIKRRCHICSICSREFPSGHALGGHMRVHGALFAEASAEKERKRREKTQLAAGKRPASMVFGDGDAATPLLKKTRVSGSAPQVNREADSPRKAWIQERASMQAEYDEEDESAVLAGQASSGEDLTIEERMLSDSPQEGGYSPSSLELPGSVYGTSALKLLPASSTEDADQDKRIDGKAALRAEEESETKPAPHRRGICLRGSSVL